jgi:hypothetical protein
MTNFPDRHPVTPPSAAEPVILSFAAQDIMRPVSGRVNGHAFDSKASVNSTP